MSALFAGAADLDTSEVSAADTRGTRYYLNSEGFRAVSPLEMSSVRVIADARAEDGMTVRDAITWVERRLGDMPSAAEMAARTREFVTRVQETRRAPFGEEYTGPVLVEGQAAAELIGQTLVPAMLARRPPESENSGRGGRGGGPQVTPFLRRIGLRVLSEPFSASDTPSMKEFNGRPVAGAYAVDDVGVRPKDVSLVEKGRLVTLLTGRTPLKGLPQSNGHWRNGGVQAGVFQMQSSTPMSSAALRRAYLDLLKTQDKPFGYIVRAVANPSDVPAGGGPALGPMILQAVKVTPSGREEVVRGIRFGAVAPAMFRDLLDGSTERTLHSYRVGGVDAVSVIVPNLIFEELEIQRTREVLQKAPIVPSPLVKAPGPDASADR
jgi:hypothetical protein